MDDPYRHLRPLMRALGMNKAAVGYAFEITEPVIVEHDREFTVAWREFARDDTGRTIVRPDGDGLEMVTKRAAVVVDFLPS